MLKKEICAISYHFPPRPAVKSSLNIKKNFEGLYKNALLEAERNSIGKRFRKIAPNPSFTLNMAGSE
jgi:hypothetical protein